MAVKKVGVLVKEARTAAGFTQEKLAKAAGEKLTASDISKCERGEADLTTNQLKKIAVACGVTQASLVNAPKNVKASEKKEIKVPSKTTAKTPVKTTTKTPAKTTEKISAKTGGRTSAAAKVSSSANTASSKAAAAKKTTVPAAANTSMKVTSTEKKLIEAYREASSDMKKVAMKVLKGEYGETINTLLSAGSGSGTTAADGIGEMLGGLLGNLLGGK